MCVYICTLWYRGEGICVYICTLWYRPYIGSWYLQCQVWLFSLFDPGYTVWRVWEGVGQWVWWELWSSLAANLYSLPETEVCHFPFCKLYFDIRLQVFSADTARAPDFLWCAWKAWSRNPEYWGNGGAFWTMHWKIRTAHLLKEIWV